MTIPFRRIREVRRARADEAARLVALAREAPAPLDGVLTAEADLLGWLADPRGIVYVAAPLTEPAVGLVAVAEAPAAWAGEGTRYIVPLLFVAEAHRGRGWGTGLLEAALQFARRRRARGVFVRLADAAPLPSAFARGRAASLPDAEGRPAPFLEFHPDDHLARSAR